MTTEPKYVTFNTDMGWMGILSSLRGLQRITLPLPSAQEAHRQLGDSIGGAVWSPDLFEDLIRRFRAYFSGQEATFPDRLDLSGATAFQRRVWEAARLISHGNTRSYLWVAEQIGKPKAARAVGQALGKNPLPIVVPCHRVIAGDGKLGGFSDGVEMKGRLLHLEGSR